MGYLSRLQGCLLPYPNTGTIQEISQISCPGSELPIQSIAFRSVHSTHGGHCVSKGGETDGHTQRYKDPPIPRRLVGESQLPPGLSSAYTNFSENVSRVRLAGEHGQVRTGTQASLLLRRLPVRPQVRLGQTDTGPVAKPSGENTNTFVTTGLSGPAVHVPDRPTNSHRKASSSWPTPHETHPVASQKQLEGTGISRKDYPSTQVPAPTLAMVARREQCVTRSTITPNKTCSANIYRRIKRKVGRSLKRAHCKRSWSVPESKLHINYLELKAVFLALKEFQDLCVGKIVLVATDNTTVVAYINQGGGMRSGPLCALLWRILTWCSQRQVTLKARHIPGHLNVIADKLSRLGQTIQTEWSLLPEVFQRYAANGTSLNRSVCHEVQPQITSICVSSSGPPGCSSGCTHPAMGGSCLPTDRHLGQSGGKAVGVLVPEIHSDRPRVAQHALVLGLGGHVQSNPPQPAKSAQSVDTALQSDPSQKSDKSKSPCMVPRATAIKEQGFSEAVAAQIEAPQRRSTRSVY